MRQRLRRFGLVGLVVTTIDVGLLLALRLGAGIPVVAADAVSITVAAWASYLLHRTITFGDDPHLRWVKEPATFAWVTLVAGAVDIIFVRAGVAVASLLDAGRMTTVLAPKAIALVMAAGVRVTSYRSVLFRRVRSEQGRRPASVAGPGGDGTLRLSVVVPAYREGAPDRAHRRAVAERARWRCPRRWAGGGCRGRRIRRRHGRPGGRGGRRSGHRAAGEPREGRGGARRDAGGARPHARVHRRRPVVLPDQLLRLLAEVESGWDMVVGSRTHVETTTLVRNRRLREVSGRVFNTLTLAVLLGQYRDTQCGLKAFRADAARLLFSHTHVDGFAFDVELFHLAERYRLSLAEVPVELANSSTLERARRCVDALRIVRDLFRVRRWAAHGVYDVDPAGEPLSTTK